MKAIHFFLLFIIFISPFSFSQNEIITVIGDSLVGKVVDGESIREVHGNVVLTQGNIVITCNTAIQFIARNDAELIGNVVIVQDSLTITTERGFYFGNLRKSESKTAVKLDDKKVILTANSGEYYFEEDRALFRNNVRLFDSLTTLTSDELTYYTDYDSAIARGNVKIVDQDNIINADILRHNRRTQISIADNNVSIFNRLNSITIYGGHLEDYSELKYTLVTIDPVLVQIDTSVNSSVDSLGNTITETEIDTLVIRSLVMEAYRDTTNLFKASDSVRIVRGDFASVNDITFYYRADDLILTHKTEPGAEQPVIWYANSQLTGDSINIFLKDNAISKLDVKGNSFILSGHMKFTDRFDQISGERIVLSFEESNLKSTEVFGSVLSIYYLYEEDEANGLTKSSSQSAKIVFNNNEVDEVRLYGIPASEYYPERLVAGKENSFLLPDFNPRENRPEKESLIQNLIIKENYE